MSENITTYSDDDEDYEETAPEVIENSERMYPYGKLVCANPKNNYYVLHVTSEGLEATFNTSALMNTNSGWYVSCGTYDYYKFEKVSNTVLKVSISPNSTGKRRGNKVFIYDPDYHAIEIIQEAGYNRLHKILPSKQITSAGCATTCLGMCVFKTPEEMKADGIYLDYVTSWSEIAAKYGYSYEGSDSTTLKTVYDYLAEGLPVTVQVNTGDMQHWVVVYAYTGNGTNLKASDFMCADPSTKVEQLLKLSNARFYNNVNLAKVFRKK